MNPPPTTPPRSRAGAWCLVLLTLAAAGMVAVDMVRHPHGHFAFEAWPGISGAIGFGAAVLLMCIAGILRRLLKREENYYADE
jgi:fatty acid desaturase